MAYELNKIQRIKSNIDEYRRRQLRLASFSDKSELEFHMYIKEICQRLLGDSINLDEEQIMFALSDNKEKDAAFTDISDQNKIIFITESLFELCENEDQLAFVLAHELGHFEEHLRQGRHINTKAEEVAADLRAIQKMARGGYNLEEAHNIAKKLFEGGYFSIESLKDEHINDTTRKNAIDAMIIAQKNILIEDGKEDVKSSTQIDKKIKRIIEDRPVSMSFIEVLYNKISNTEDADDHIKAWIETFHDNKIFHNGKYTYTKDEIKDFAYAIDHICRNKTITDRFFYAILTDLEKNKYNPKHQFDSELISNIFYEIYTYDNRSYSHTVVDADKENSLTAGFLRRYLKGFREATDADAVKLIQRFNYIKNLTARHNGDDYKGILVKNFNLMEFEFNQNDVNKKISPQILQLVKSNLNAKNVFETFSGLTVNKLGDNLLFTQESQNWSLFVTRDGVVKYSFPREELEQIQVKLMAEVVENTYKDVKKLKNGENISQSEQIEILENAYNILYPQATKNNLSQILKITTSTQDKQILFDDVMAELSSEAREFFAEKVSYPHNSDNLPYTSFVIDSLAECIKNAPKEKMEDIYNYLYIDSSTRGHWKCFGDVRLWQAFLDNPAFFEEIQSKIKNTALVPETKNQWSFTELFNDEEKLFLDAVIGRLTAITDDALHEHLHNGGDFNDFEPPFNKKIIELCEFGKQGLSKEEIEESINQSHNITHSYASFLQQAYMLCYSYDTLKDNVQLDLNKTFGANKAGREIKNKIRILEYNIEEREKASINEEELKIIQDKIKVLDASYKKIHQRQVEQVYDSKNWSKFDGSALFYAVLYNNDNNLSFRSIVERKDFKDILLEKYVNDDDRHSCILALGYIVNEASTDKKNNEIKKQIWPIISSVFERTDLTTFDKVKTFQTLAENNIFASDNQDYYDILIGPDGKSGLLAEISKESNFTQLSLYKKLLDKHTRIPDPQIREDIVKKTALAFWNEYGKYNDINASEQQRADIIKKIKWLKEDDIAEMDKIELLKEISELTLSQKELSLFMKPESVNVQTSDSSAIISSYSVDGLSFLMHSYPSTKNCMQEFLLGEGTSDEAENLIRELYISVCSECDKHENTNLCERYLKGEDITDDLPYYTKDYINKLNVGSLKTFKKEFDAASLEIKALLVNELLTTGRSSWEDSFNIVSSKLFEGAGDLAKIGSDFLYNYISARPDSEKTFYLAAMMAAANNKSKQFATQYNTTPYTPEQRNLAKGLRLFLESSGPAGTKLAQAMSSYNLVPDFIRYEMQFAKSQANPPARWDIFADQSEVMDKLLQYGPLGKRRGSASFFVTYDLGDKIVKILRRGAKVKADNEFEIYNSMLEKLSKNYDNISSFSRLVKNASDNVVIETDLDIGLSQFKDAKKMYPPTVEADNVEFKINVMDWVAQSSTWAIMEKAQGVDFKDLEEPYKTAAAKAIFSTELANILSGKRFDSDRHGGQYKINPKTNEIGVFDTGSISMTEPTAKEQQVLGIVLARTVKGLRYDMNMANVFSQQIDKAVDEFYAKELKANKSVPPYLSEVQRGLLALNDFYTDLSSKDIMECVLKSLNNGHHKINDNIVTGFKTELTKGITEKSVESVISPEHIDKLAPEARAKRKVGQILFNKVFESIVEDKEVEINPQTMSKLLPHLQNDSVDLQIVKGFVRGAYAKLNPSNYSKEDKEELGKVLYQVCRSDIFNKKLRKDSDIHNIFDSVKGKGQYCQNISAILKMLSKVPSIKGNKIKRAAIFVAFADKDVAKGWKKALKEDKNISLGKRLLMSIEPMDFIPPKSKKLLIKSVGKKLILSFLKKKLNIKSVQNTPEK